MPLTWFVMKIKLNHKRKNAFAIFLMIIQGTYLKSKEGFFFFKKSNLSYVRKCSSPTTAVVISEQNFSFLKKE